MIDKQSALIARCTGVAVRGGGHHTAGYGVREDGLVIYLNPMKGMRVDLGSTVSWLAFRKGGLRCASRSMCPYWYSSGVTLLLI
jgi:hypothetical protein